MKYSTLKSLTPSIISRNAFYRAGNLFAMSITVLSCVLLTQATVAQCADNNNSNAQLLHQYIQAKGAGIIVFDESNIKQFWIDNSIIARKAAFDVLLNKTKTQSFESVPLTIQLMNVNEAQDCKVEVVSETKDFGFSILDNKSKVISSSKNDNDFLDYSVASSVFHLEDTTKLTFVLKFNSKTAEALSIKKIILSFSDNKDSRFLMSPGKISYSPTNINTSSKTEKIDDESFSATANRTVIYSSKSIIADKNTISCSVTIKNTGTTPTSVYVGYAVSSHDFSRLDGRNYPYKPSNKVLNVVSSSSGSPILTVDSYSDWAKGCLLALNAKENQSDIPNNTFAGTIVEVKQLENGQAEIVLDKPLKTELTKGTKVRVHGQTGAFLYTGYKVLQPGEEQVFTSSIQKDDAFLEYSPKAIARGIYCVMPLILSYSTDPSKENTIRISNFSISY